MRFRRRCPMVCCEMWVGLVYGLRQSRGRDAIMLLLTVSSIRKNNEDEELQQPPQISIRGSAVAHQLEVVDLRVPSGTMTNWRCSPQGVASTALSCGHAERMMSTELACVRSGS
jgi:hypothetical protein